MKTVVLTMLAVLAMAVPSGTWGQQAIPVYQAKSPTVVLDYDRSVNGASLTSRVLDVSGLGYASVFLDINDRPPGFTDACSDVYVTMEGSNTNVTAEYASLARKGLGRLTAHRTNIEVSFLPNFIKITIAASGAANCRIRTAVVFQPFATVTQVTGSDIEGTAWPLNNSYPVIVGAYTRVGRHGVAPTSVLTPLALDGTGRPSVVGGYTNGDATGTYTQTLVVAGSDGTNVRTFKTDANGNLLTKNPGATTETFSELLVDVAATAVPTSATARSTTIQNIGPKPIYCGFTNAVTALNGLRIDTGQGATFDTAAAPAMYCICATLQVAGAGTRVILSDTPDTVRFYGGGGATATDASLQGGLEEKLVNVTATQISSSTTYGSLSIQNTGPNPIYCGTSNAVTTATGIKIGTDQGATFDKLDPSSIYCITTVLQVTGAATRYGVGMTYDRLRLYGGGSASGDGAQDVAVPSVVALSANVAGSICSLTTLATYRISCDAAATFRTGAATPTAVSTDSALFASTIMDVKLGTGKTCFSFLSGSAVNCRAALLTP